MSFKSTISGSQDHLGRIVCGSVKETLNALLDAKAIIWLGQDGMSGEAGTVPISMVNHATGIGWVWMTPETAGREPQR